MPFHLPLRRFLQGTEKTKPPQTRFGSLEWVLARPLYRFKTLDLNQVPVRSRPQALRLELTQWTPFENSAYYIGWHGHNAMVWAWDATKAEQAIVAQGLNPLRTRVLPETVLQISVEDGLALHRCTEGVEGQLWRKGQLQHSRWWPQVPTLDEWLMFQRDAGVPPGEQQSSTPTPRDSGLSPAPWISQASSTDTAGTQWERMLYAIGFLALLLPTLWLGMGHFKLQQSTAQLLLQKAQLQSEAQPIIQARSDARGYLDTILALRTAEPYPTPLSLMATIVQVLPKDQSSLKDWDFQQGQLKITLGSATDISTTQLIGRLQQAGPFHDVKSLPGRDAKNVTFQMDVAPVTSP